MPLNQQNIYGVQPAPLDYSGEQPATRSKTYHGFGIVVNNEFVASIQSWSPQAFGRTVTGVKELSPATYGRFVDAVPAGVTDQTISMSRIEIWENELEKALGLSAEEWVDLVDQNRPFTIMEVMYKGTQLYRIWEYLGCWFTDKNIGEFSVGGDGIVMLNASILYVTRRLAYGI